MPNWREGGWRDAWASIPPGRRLRDPDERGALLALLLAANALFGLAVGGLTLVQWTSNRPPTTQVTTPTGQTVDPEGATVAAIGPPPGENLASYANRRKQALAAATGTRLAVVSLTRYLTVEAVREAVDASIEGYLVAAPEGGPEHTADVGAWAGRARKAAAGERTEIERLIPTVDDPEFKAFYIAEVARLKRLEGTLGSGGGSADVVFGVVVKGPADELRALAGQTVVRLVDPGTSGRSTGDVQYSGVRPEETVRGGEPPLRPA